MISSLLRLTFLVLLSVALPLPALRAQFEEDPKAAAKAKDPQIDKTVSQKFKIGVEVTAVGGPCRGIRATLPIPDEWPEQKITVIEDKKTPNVKNISFKTIGGGVRQMVIDIPAINPNEIASAYVILEVKRSSTTPPLDTGKLQIPTKQLPAAMQLYLNESPYIEARHPKIAALAKELPPDAKGWERVEAIYDLTRSKIEYTEGPIQGAVKALQDGRGDCEELTSLFIALCRQQRIPARTVWVTGHCYPEFYLVDDKGEGHWYPCQAAGTRAFGGIPETRPILQKGDNFQDPDRPRERLRYVSEFMKGVAVKGGGDPKHKFIREALPD